jgi:hypothetical protein
MPEPLARKLGTIRIKNMLDTQILESLEHKERANIIVNILYS